MKSKYIKDFLILTVSRKMNMKIMELSTPSQMVAVNKTDNTKC